jgi:beta-glucanase (GH16 family)
MRIGNPVRVTLIAMIAIVLLSSGWLGSSVDAGSEFERTWARLDLHVSVDGEPVKCKQENITVSGNGNVEQSSSSVIIQKSGDGSTTVYCSQKNVTTESR